MVAAIHFIAAWTSWARVTTAAMRSARMIAFSAPVLRRYRICCNGMELSDPYNGMSDQPLKVFYFLIRIIGLCVAQFARTEAANVLLVA